MNNFIKATILLLLSSNIYAKSDDLCLAEAIYNEARGESELGKQAVSAVVLNRAKKSGMSLCKVVYYPGQFSWTKRKKSSKVSDDILELAKKLSHGKFKDPTNGSTFFCTKRIMKRFQKANKLRLATIIGNHAFFYGEFVSG